MGTVEDWESLAGIPGFEGHRTWAFRGHLLVDL